MKKASQMLLASIVTTLSLSLVAETLLGQDWSRYRQDVLRCASDDATCVGLTLIEIMQELHHRRDYQVNCTCSSSINCIVAEGGIRNVIPERIPFTFTSNCLQATESAREKWAFCSDGAGSSNYTLYSIDPRRLSFVALEEFTFSSNCQNALREL